MVFLQNNVVARFLLAKDQRRAYTGHRIFTCIVMYKNCQSCMMPLGKDPSGGATNADGSKNEMYCGLCYSQGSFVHPEWTVRQMQRFVVEKMKEMGIPRFLGRFFVMGMPRLERWKQH